MDGPKGSAPGAANACINNNVFVAGTGLTDGILAAFRSDIGSGNELNGLSSNLTPGRCSGRCRTGAPNHEYHDELGFGAPGKVKQAEDPCCFEKKRCRNISKLTGICRIILFVGTVLCSLEWLDRESGRVSV
jgi:hypothetical protein